MGSVEIVLSLFERTKDPRLVLRRNTHPIVGDGDHQNVVIQCRGNFQLATVARKFDRVGQQVQQNLTDHALIDISDDTIFRDIEFNLNVVTGRLFRDNPVSGIDKGADVDLIPLQLPFTGVHF